MPFAPPTPVSVAYPDVYYTTPLVSGLVARRDLTLHALPPHQSDVSALTQHGCVFVPPSVLLEAPELRLLPGIGVAAHGATGSERLVTSAPLEGITEIGIHPEAGHLWPILELLYLARELTPPSRVPYAADGSVPCLISGNTGQEMADAPGHDLGTLWHETTELPLVLGVWACAPGSPYRMLRTVLGGAARSDVAMAPGERSLLHTSLLSRESDSLRALYALAVTHGRAEANEAAIVFC